jgi:hypothetical protein
MAVNVEKYTTKIDDFVLARFDEISKLTGEKRKFAITLIGQAYTGLGMALHYKEWTDTTNRSLLQKETLEEMRKLTIMVEYTINNSLHEVSHLIGEEES